MTVQQRLCNNKWFRLAVSVILTLAVVTVFVCAPFAQAHAIVGVDDALIVIVIAGLAAAGITFTSTGAFDNLVDYVGSLIEEYASDAGTTAMGLFSDVQYSNNKVGQLLLNNRFVRLISAFATWVKAKFSLTNNETINVIEPGATLDNMVMYALPITLYDINATNGRRYEYTIASTGSEQYALFEESNNVMRVNVVSTTPGSTIRVLRTDNSPGTPVTLTLEETNSGLYAVKDIGFNKSAYGSGYTLYPQEYIESALNGNGEIDVNNVSIGINTGVINPPLDDEDYEDGDGALVDVGTTWGGTLKDILDKIRAKWQSVQTGEQEVNMEFAEEGEIEAQLPEQTDIENLPGGTAWNPTDQQLKFFEFESIWHYVAQWIQDFTAGAAVVWNAAIQLPSPVVNMVYAMVTLSIIFGVIKVMRA